jgi:hypothetical protein
MNVVRVLTIVHLVRLKGVLMCQDLKPRNHKASRGNRTTARLVMGSEGNKTAKGNARVDSEMHAHNKNLR